MTSKQITLANLAKLTAFVETLPDDVDITDARAPGYAWGDMRAVIKPTSFRRLYAGVKVERNGNHVTAVDRSVRVSCIDYELDDECKDREYQIPAAEEVQL